MSVLPKINVSDEKIVSDLSVLAWVSDHAAVFLLDDGEDLGNCMIRQIAGLPNMMFAWTTDRRPVTLREALNFNDDEMPEAFKLTNKKVFDFLEDVKKKENRGRFLTVGVTIAKAKHPYSFSITTTYLSNKKQFLVYLVHIPEFDALQNHLIEAAEIDEGTGLLGRKALKYELEKREYDDNSYFLFMDINGFKELNDKNGHVVGDRVLKEFAEALKSVDDPRWTAYRYGGDEFAVIVHSGDIEEVKELIWKVKYYIDDHLKPEFDIYFSTGAVKMYSFFSEALDLIKCADEAMYKAKNGQRHFYCASEETARATNLK